MEIATVSLPQIGLGIDYDGLFRELCREWSSELDPQEKEVWLWNVWVEMLRIKQRRPQN